MGTNQYSCVITSYSATRLLSVGEGDFTLDVTVEDDSYVLLLEHVDDILHNN